MTTILPFSRNARLHPFAYHARSGRVMQGQRNRGSELVVNWLIALGGVLSRQLPRQSIHRGLQA